MKRTKVVTIAVAASAVVGLAVGAVGTAHADSTANADKISICPTGGDDFTKVSARGINQNGEFTQVTVDATDQCTPINGYWWIGPVDILVSESKSGRYMDTEFTCAEAELNHGWRFCTFQADPIVPIS